ncbi:Aste57867_13218 [Aphanomyces stellatus]|uniref:Aste57867_13218 protein n=1 Tax=Aphanomyces stellatus TaxID=120398 RepID=A0A485KXJ2_9STRA|nr:hypothetical protein As57867_013169 [Aphanomyces stellatus]VFT90058.1 Aste57867_13218 [Aphanomyces stellatus]
MEKDAAVAAPKSFLTSLVVRFRFAGGMAGTGVDVALYPIDTIKTRLQSSQGFVKAGGFKGVYKGISAAAAGSAPGAALFFSTYETTKAFLQKQNPHLADSPVIHMASAAMGETASCLVRGPTEIVKQNLQTGAFKTFAESVQSIYSTRGIGGFYRGYFSLLAREIPFSFIQFPLWEGLKSSWGKYQGESVSPVQGAICGSISGGFAACVTTPLDDAKGIEYRGMKDTFVRVYTQEGWQTLFSGVKPRTMWITIGGFVFFGVYEQASASLSTML